MKAFNLVEGVKYFQNSANLIIWSMFCLSVIKFPVYEIKYEIEDCICFKEQKTED